jgi:hypothetical protein
MSEHPQPLPVPTEDEAYDAHVALHTAIWELCESKLGRKLTYDETFKIDQLVLRLWGAQ